MPAIPGGDLNFVPESLVIALALGITYPRVSTPHSLIGQLGLVFLGVGLIGLGSGFYLTSGHGPGPRDGWMTGLHRVTGWPVGRVRLLIEVSVLVLGWLLGGIVGVGTAIFALLVVSLSRWDSRWSIGWLRTTRTSLGASWARRDSRRARRNYLVCGLIPSCFIQAARDIATKAGWALSKPACTAGGRSRREASAPP